MLSQKRKLFRRFYSLGYDPEPQAVRHAYDGEGYGGVIRVCGYVPYKRLVYLQLVYRKPLQIVQRRISRPKIVNGQQKPHPFHFLHGCHGGFDILHDRPLGQFQFHVTRIYLRIHDRSLNGFQEIRLTELDRGKVYGHRNGLKSRYLPLPILPARSTKHPFTYRNDQAAVFRYVDEPSRRDQSHIRVLPAYQGFRADDLPGLYIHLRLIMQYKFLTLNGPAQVVFH